MLNRKGQNIAEYSILIALVIAAAVAMQVYVKRGLQGRVKETVDHTGNVGDVGGTALNLSGSQYEPYYVDTDVKRATESEVSEAAGARGETKRTIIQEKETKTGTEKITYEQGQ